MGREAAEGLEPSPEVAGREEVREGEACRAVGPSGMPNAQLGMVVVVVALDGGVPDLRFIGATWRFVHGWLGLARRCSMPLAAQIRSKRIGRE